MFFILRDNQLTMSQNGVFWLNYQVEQTIDQVQQVGSDVLDTAQKIYQTLADALKPGIDAAAPVVQQAGVEALKAASPIISEASKKAQEAIQSTGISSDTVATATKVCLVLAKC